MTAPLPQDRLDRLKRALEPLVQACCTGGDGPRTIAIGVTADGKWRVGPCGDADLHRYLSAVSPCTVQALIAEVEAERAASRGIWASLSRLLKAIR